MVCMVSSTGVMLQKSSFSLLISWICPNISMKKHCPESFIFILSSMGITSVWRFWFLNPPHLSVCLRGNTRATQTILALLCFLILINDEFLSFLIIIRQITLVSALFYWYLLEIPIIMIKKMTNCFSLSFSDLNC